MATPTPEEMAQAQEAAKLAEKGQEAITKAKKDYTEALAEANKVKTDGNTLLKEESDLMAKLAEQKSELKKVRADELKENGILADLQKDLLSLNGQQAKQKRDSIAMQKAIIAQKQVERQILADEMAQQKESLEIVKKATKFQKKYGEQVKENLDDANKKVNTIEKAMAKFAGKLPVIGNALRKTFDMKDNLESFGTNLTELGKSMKPGSPMGKALQSAGGKITKFAGGLSLATLAGAALIIAAGAMALQFDNLSKEIGRTTGLGDKFALTLNKGYRQTILSGVSMKEYAGAVTSLANNFSGFNPTAEKTNIHLANTTSRLEKLGVSADSSSKLMDHFHRAMGLSQKAAADMTAQLVMLGREVGITASKMAADFQAASGRLAMYGKDTIKEFKALAVQAKATGLEVGSLLSISEKYDTFESAAEHAGKLNAVLGTQISTVAMLNMGEAERIKMIKEQVQASVGNFDSLDKHTKRYIALSMGVKDVAEAQRLLNMSQAETAANAAKMQKQADIQAELAEATAELVPMMTKLKLIGMKLFMVFSPLISAFTGLFEILDWAYESMAPFLQGMGDMGDMMIAVKLAAILLGVGIMAFLWPVTSTVGIIIAVVAALGTLYDILHKPGSPSMAGGLFEHIGASIAKFGEMILWPLKAVGMFADAISGLWGSAHSDEPNPIVAPEVDTSGISGGFDIQALAEIDTSKVAAGINEIKSAVMELAGIKMDGFLAMHTDGSSSSFVMGSDGLIKSISEGKLIVDVKMPEMKLPEVLVKVFIGDRELKGIIRTEVQAQVGAMG